MELSATRVGSDSSKALQLPASSTSQSTGANAELTSASDDIGRKASTVFHPPRWFYRAFSALSVLALAAALGSTSLAIALPNVAQSLRLSTSQAFWLGTSASLASTVFQPGCACLTDTLGQRRALALCATALNAGSLIAALAHNFPLILSGRCLQGIGIGGVTAVTDIIVTGMVPLRFRGQWFALISVPWAFGTVAGPILGGAIVQTSSWRWIFALNILLCSLGIVLSLIFLRIETKCSRLIQKLCHVDWAGFTLLTGSLIAILVPITQAGTVYPWKDYHTLLPLFWGLAVLIFFLFYEYKLAENPLIPLAAFKNRSCILTFFCTTLHGLVVWCLLYYLPLYYEVVQDLSPTQSGLAMLPESLTIVPASILTGFSITWSGRYRWAIWTGWAMTTLGVGLLHFLDVGTPRYVWIGLNLIAGWGTGMLFGAMGFAVQASVSSSNMPIAVTMFTFFRSLGAATGIATGAAIFQTRFHQELSRTPDLGQSGQNFARDGVALIGYIKSLSDDRLRSALVHAYAESLQTVWLAIAVMSGVAMLASLFVESCSLDGLPEVEGEKGSDTFPES